MKTLDVFEKRKHTLILVYFVIHSGNSLSRDTALYTCKTFRF